MNYLLKSMWTKEILDRYAEKIPEEKLKQQFRALIRSIQWQGREGFETCLDENLSMVAKNMQLEDLIKDLSRRYLEFSARPVAGQMPVRSRKNTIPL